MTRVFPIWLAPVTLMLPSVACATSPRTDWSRFYHGPHAGLERDVREAETQLREPVADNGSARLQSMVELAEANRRAASLFHEIAPWEEDPESRHAQAERASAMAQRLDRMLIPLSVHDLATADDTHRLAVFHWVLDTGIWLTNPARARSEVQRQLQHLEERERVLPLEIALAHTEFILGRERQSIRTIRRALRARVTETWVHTCAMTARAALYEREGRQAKAIRMYLEVIRAAAQLPQDALMTEHRERAVERLTIMGHDPVW